MIELKIDQSNVFIAFEFSNKSKLRSEKKSIEENKSDS